MVLNKAIVGSLVILFLSTNAFAEREAPKHVYLRKGKFIFGIPTPPNPAVLMTYHNGSVLHTNSTMAIFWGTQWNTPSFASDKITGLDQFFSGINNSSYARTALEYHDNSAPITTSSTYLGHVLDTTPAPNSELTVDGAVAEACKITNNNPNPNAIYFIYTSTGAGNVNYCAWHSYGNCSNGDPIQVGYMPNITGIAGCDPVDHVTGHSQGLAALANVSAHELMESITDPRDGGWYDSSGNENGDKCAWSYPFSFSSWLGLNGISTLSNGSEFKLQMEWSNAAYLASTGAPNLSGQRGCIH